MKKQARYLAISALPWCVWLVMVSLLLIQPGCLPRAERRCESQASCDGTTRPTVCFQGMCVLKVCTPGKRQSCYEVTCGPDNAPCPAKVRGVGNCKEGYQLCLDNGSRWSACFGSIPPQKEVCDGVDNDCDGNTDNGVTCTCQRGELRPCYTGRSTDVRDKAGTPCVSGIQRCIRGVNGQDTWGKCEHQRTPNDLPQERIESCQLQDVDCDGTPDQIGVDCRCPKEGDSRPCYTGQGAVPTRGPCKAGTQTCKNDQGKLAWGACVLEVLPSPEEKDDCDDKDNDCDGKVDNATGTNAPLSRPCGDLKDCKVEICAKGTWGLCEKKEICTNQLDDNCDGSIDEQPCTAAP